MIPAAQFFSACPGRCGTHGAFSPSVRAAVRFSFSDGAFRIPASSSASVFGEGRMRQAFPGRSMMAGAKRQTGINSCILKKEDPAVNIGIIGYGSMGKMLTDRFTDSGSGSLYVANRTQEKLSGISKSVTVCRSNAELASCSDIIFLCVRPADLRTVLEEIRADLKDSSLIVSLNGSISFDQIGKLVRHKTAKVIPSVTAEINRSETLVCFNELARASDRKTLKQLLGCFGNVIELPEKEMGMGSELVSCMPGFIASIFDVLCRAAEKHTDLPEDQIIRMVLSTMCATGELMLEKGMSFEDVVSRVATKGGITEEGTDVIYQRFPETAELLFEKTLEKRKMTAQQAEKMF